MKYAFNNPLQTSDRQWVLCKARFSPLLLSFLLLTPASPQKTGNGMFVLSELSRKPYGQFSLDFETLVTRSESQTEVTSESPVVVEPKSLPLEWLLGQKDCTLAQVERARANSSSEALPSRVLARLVQLEAHEANTHLKSDYRQAWITLSFALKGISDAFVQSSYAMYGIHPDKVWPRIVADRKARLGSEYHDFYDSADVLRPDVPKIPPTATADTHAANGADLSTGTVGGSVPINKEVV